MIQRENNRDDLAFVVVVSSIPGDQTLCNIKDNTVHHCSICGTRNQIGGHLFLLMSGEGAITNGVAMDDGVDRIVPVALAMQV